MAYLEQTDKKICTQDNQIIEACYSMTLIEKRLLMLAISKIDSTQFPKAHKPLIVSIDMQEWANCYNLQNPWQHVVGAAKSLRGRYVKFHPKAGTTKEVNWFDSIEYHDNDSYLTIQFSRSMQVRLSGMLEQFTKVDLLSVSQLRSIHAIRLYELLSQFKSTGYRAMTIKDFRFAMDCEDTYKETKSLARAVIKPAIKEINTKTNLTVTLENIKRGRKITAFKFIFTANKQADLFAV